MILPIKESGVNCFDRLSYIHSLGEDDILTEKIEDTFTENPDYVPVYRNFDYSKTFDIWCYNGTAPDKTQPYKRFLSYPYPEIEFRIGDYISFDYRQDGTMSHFLVESCDYQKKYDINGRMWLVNQELKWVDEEENLHIYQSVFEDALTYTNFKYGAQGLVEPNGSIVILVTQDDLTRTIYKNQRFLFSGVPYMVKQVLKSVDKRYMEIYMFEVPLNQYDNVEDNIAYNGRELRPTGETEIRVTPDDAEVTLGEVLEFEAYTYLDGEKQDNSFTFSASGVPDKNYVFRVVGSNTFSIECLKPTRQNALSVICRDDVTGEEVTKGIWLTEGGWL